MTDEEAANHVADRQMNNSEVLRFDVDAGLILELGERLVTRQSIALAELIKNAYDADATEVKVRLEDVTHPGGTVIVEDNGNGMTLQQLRRGWMRVATDQARVQPISPRFGRPRTGAKGVGRFACMRLGRRATIQSVGRLSSGSCEIVEATFDWDMFRSGLDLESVEVDFTRTTAPEEAHAGVRLLMKDTPSVWNESDIIRLQRDLLELVSPFPPDATDDFGHGDHEPDPGFSVKFELPEFPKYEGLLTDMFLSGAWGILDAELDENGAPKYSFDVRKGDRFSYRPSDITFRHLVGAKARIHYFVYVGTHFRDLEFSLRDAQTLGREKGGVRIYLDRFRVFPYGDPGDDWLGIDADRSRRAGVTPHILLPFAEGLEQPMEHLPSNQQLFGSVALSTLRNPEISVNISRERLVQNDAFFELRAFLRTGIDWMTIQYVRVQTEQKRSLDGSSATARRTIFETLDRARELLTEGPEGAEAQRRAEIMATIDVAEGIARQVEEERMGELAMLRVLASAGSMVLILEHTLEGLVNGLGQIHTDLSELRPMVSSQATGEFDEVVDRLNRWREAVQRQASQVGLLVGSEARTRRRSLALKPVIDELPRAFAQYMGDFGIDFSSNVAAHLRTPPMFESELNCILLNLLTNALKAVRTQPTRRVEVTASQESDGLHILMRDSGVGLDPARREEVFDAFVTTSVPDPMLGVGTGLGLKIVRDILANYGGEARFVDVNAPWKTCVEVFLPQEA